MNDPKPICIYLLGGFRILLGEDEILPERIRLRKARSLLKLLALAPTHQIHREQLMEQLWPELEPHWAANNLNQAVFAARRALSVEGNASRHYLIYQDEQLSLGAAAWVDVEAFESAVTRAHASHDPADYQAALDLYTGELLPEDRYEDWAVLPRENLKQAHLQLLLELSSLYASRRKYLPAIQTMKRALAVDPLNEDAHARLIRLYALSGQRQLAVQQYQSLQETLQRELGIQPEPKTTRLYKEIQSGRFQTPEMEKSGELLPTPRHNLPSPLSSFIGREKQIEQVQRILEGARLVTLTGSGGVGKTRLSLQVAEGVLDQFADGIWYVEFAPVSDSELVPQIVAKALGLQEAAGQSVIASLVTYFKERQALLVLDNCEHLLESCAILADTLLRNAPYLKVLASSREALGITGESAFHVPSLATPDPRQIPGLAEFKEVEAVRLFTERVQAVQPDFQIDEQNAPAVAQICRRLDGIPLALELAAARLNLLTTGQLASRLDDAFRLLSGGSRTALPRQQTLRAAIDWSYQLLSPPEQRLLRRLSVLAGGGTLATIEAVCSGDGLEVEEILDLLTGLAKKSMLQVDRLQQAETRYRLLETVRQFAREKLNDAGESQAYHDRHFDHFLKLAETIEPQLQTSNGLEMLELLQREIDNLRAGLSWSLDGDHNPRVTAGLCLASALLELWRTQNFHTEGLAWLQKGLDNLVEDTPENRKIRAKSLFAVGNLLLLVNRNRESTLWLEKSAAIYEEMGDRIGTVRAQSLLAGNLAWLDVTSQRARELHESSLKMARSLQDPSLLALVNSGLGNYFTLRRDYPTALRHLEESLAILESLGAILRVEDLQYALGSIAYKQGNYAQAKEYLQRALISGQARRSNSMVGTTFGVMGEVEYMQDNFEQMEANFRAAQEQYWKGDLRIPNMWLLRGLGITLKRQGRVDEAVNSYLESLSLAQESKDFYGMYAAMAGVAGTGIASGVTAQAVRLQGAVAALFAAFLKPLDPWEQREFDHDLAQVKTALGEDEFRQAWAEGQAFSLEQALKETHALASELQSRN